MGEVGVIAEGFDDLMGDFLDESSQLIERLNDDLLVLDRTVRGDSASSCDEDLLNRMFRSAHSIKGLSAMLGLVNINSLTHNLEHVFDAARRNELQFGPGALEAMFQAVDRLSAMIARLQECGADNLSADEALAAIQTILTPTNDAPEESEDPPAVQGLENALPPRETAIDSFPALEDEPGEDKYLAMFFDEAEAALDEMAAWLVRGERSGQSVDWESFLVVAHRLKGSAAAVGLHRGAKLAHIIEDLVQELSENHAPLTEEVADALLHAIDALRHYVDGRRVGRPDASRFGACVEDLLAQRKRPQETSQSSAAQGARPGHGSAFASEPFRIDEAVLAAIHARSAGAAAIAVGSLRLEPRFPLAGMKARLAYEKLSQVGEVVYCLPPWEELAVHDDLERFVFVLAGEGSFDILHQRLRLSGVMELQLQTWSEFGEEARRMLEGLTVAAAPRADRSSTAPQQSENHRSVGEPKPALIPDPKGALSPVALIAVADSPTADKPAAGSSPSDQSQSVKPVETIRVDMERLDQLMNLSGQLTINRASFSQIAERLKRSLPAKQILHTSASAQRSLQVLVSAVEAGSSTGEGAALQTQLRQLQSDMEALNRELLNLQGLRGGVTQLAEAVHQLDRLAVSVQKTVMDARMAPIGPLFNRFKRVVRDITRGGGKDVRLEIEGEKTELDKRMIDELSDPLIHMVRNSVDHGLETRAERVRLGKPEQGRLRLEARHQGNSIVIEVCDDGRGLDRGRILRKAMEREIISAADAEQMSDQQAYQLIWKPGFSTAETITQISGRGMGMDIVRAKIEELHGAVEIESRPGQGARFIIRLPLTLAVLPTLMVQLSGETFAIPIEAVVEIVKVEPSDLLTIQGAPAARIRDRVVAVAPLDELLGESFRVALPMERSQTPEEQGDAILVIVGAEGREIGVPVESLIGEEDVVIKSLAENYRNVPGVSGASILGDGRVSLILDPMALVEAAYAATDLRTHP